MSNRIGRVHKLGKHNRKRPDMTTNLLKAPVLISSFHNIDDKNIYMTINSSSINTMLSTDTSAIKEKHSDIIENGYFPGCNK